MQAELDLLTSTPLAIQYRLRFGASNTTLNVYHRELIRMRVRGGKAPIEGDSGCPVVARREGNAFTLVGMFIASHEGDAYVIPAWDLFDPDQYWNLPDKAVIRPVAVSS